MAEVVVETRNLSKHYGAFVALDQLNIHICRGEVLGFIGPNGAGKTTTIKILVGLNKPTSGSATIAGLDCTAQAKKVKRLVGYMPDTFGGYENMRVREYLDFFGAAFRIPRRERAKRIDTVLEQTNASSFKDLPTEALSHGMKQKVALSRTLLHEPQVLIMDEPANGLDPVARIEMREVILRLAQAGKTVLVSSHILPELARICSSVAIITKGKLRAFGTLEEVLRSVRQSRNIEVVTLTPGALAKGSCA
jgi:ABC-2 type transport system ATP-binding protein